MNNLYWFDQIQPSDRSLVGDKAVYLSLAAQRGHSVVPGIVFPATGLRSFLEQINWLEPLFVDLPNSSLHVDVDSPYQLQAIAQHIRQALQATPLPDEWLSQIEAAAQQWDAPALILRPSLAVGSNSDPTLGYHISGLLNSHICWREPNSIANSLKRVWAELFRARSLVYWQRSGIQLQQVNVAVLVQPLWNAIASGDVLMEPASIDVRAVWGLGHALLRREAVPDCYSMQPQTGQLQKRSLGSKAYIYQLDLAKISIPSDLPVRMPSVADCLQMTAIAPDRQNQYVLTDSHLQQLSQLTQQLKADIGYALRLEWILHQPDAATEPTLHLTQANPIPLPSEDSEMLEQHASPDEAQPHLFVSSASQPKQAEDESLALPGLGASRGQTFATAWVIKDASQTPPDSATGVILVAPSITPDWLVWIKHVVGIITEQGGMTCHGAIIAREMGVPAVVGVASATTLLQTGDTVFLDGDRGIIHRLDHEDHLPPEATVNLDQRYPSPPPSLNRRSHATQLFVNLSQSDVLSQVAHLPIDGVGLLRAEMMMLTALDRKHPNQWLTHPDVLIQRITSQIRLFAEAFAPRPVFYRSLDLRSHEFALFEGNDSAPETNPMLGMHGTFSYCLNPALFEIELTALRQVQQAGYSNVHLVLPFVRTVEEFSFCQQRVIQAGLTQMPNFQLWIMAEVPSVLFLLPDYVEAGVQGIAIGTNDLMHLLLGIDRDQPKMATAFDQRHPAVMRAIKQLVETARQLGIPCSICGQAPSQHPDIIAPLIQWGITSISVNPDALEVAQAAIVRAERNLLLDAARQVLSRNS